MPPKKTRSERSLVNNSTVNIVKTVMIVIQALPLNPHNTNDSISSNYIFLK